MSDSLFADSLFNCEQFPRSAAYHPQWLIANASGGANSLWLTEWLTQGLQLRPGMRVLDLGCGRAASSIFLSREFDVQVWATDLWFSATENLQRIRDSGVEEDVFPVHADARSLPFADEFFDAIVSIDSFFYYGTDDLYLNYLSRFVKPGGVIGIAGAGTMREFEGVLPPHLKEWWTPEMWCLHSAEWWRWHWQRTGMVDVLLADTMPDGWQRWLDWHRALCPDNHTEIKAIADDAGQWMGYCRIIGRRRLDAKAPEIITTIPGQYERHQLLREPNQSV